AEDVHDFAWTADPRYQLTEDDITLSTGKVHIRVLMQPGREDSCRRYIQALKGTMRLFDQWIGPYPYPQITVVDPPHGASAAGGMEYPMFITGDTTWWIPKGILLPEIVTEHEFGHQYWYGMVATNEFEDAWLDEGINQYVESKVMNALYGPETSFFNFPFATAGERGMNRAGYLGIAEYDPMTRNGWEFVNGNAYGGTTYSKTATVMTTLEQLIGEATVRKALRTYFLRYRFKHPTEEDFMATVDEVAGRDLSWFWNQAVKGTQKLDYRVMKATSERVDWFEKKQGPEKKGETMYRAMVVVHRKGEFVYPVTLTATFDDGSVERQAWDGAERWHRQEWDRKAKLVSAEVNADGGIVLDVNRFNDSRVVAPDGRATKKISNMWMVMTQWMGQLVSWLV
ncbi:MAG TPA: M1 family aminopeptidase, partial [Holophagaceae bacterium]|nr:M1 family aminopeptidase [Holophagaceae bacterium]